MIDPFVLLAPVLVLGVLALLRFVGCDIVFGLHHVEYAPENLTGTFQAGVVNLSWEFNHDADSFTVKRGEQSGHYEDVGTTTVASFTDPDVQPEKTYYYVVTADTPDGTTRPSNELVLIAPPTSLRAAAGDGRVNLTWDKYESAQDFLVKRGESSGDYPIELTAPSAGSNPNSFTDLLVANGTKYFYNLTVRTPDGESAIDPTIEVTAIPAIAFVTSVTTGATDNTTRFAGMVIFTGLDPIKVFSLGRYVLPGNTAVHQVKIVESSTGADLAVVTVSTAGAAANTFVYADLTTPIILLPHVEYFVVSQESPTDSYYINDNGAVQTRVQTTAAAGVTSAVFIDTNSTVNRVGPVGQTFGPVDFRYVLA